MMRVAVLCVIVVAVSGCDTVAPDAGRDTSAPSMDASPDAPTLADAGRDGGGAIDGGGALDAPVDTGTDAVTDAGLVDAPTLTPLELDLADLASALATTRASADLAAARASWPALWRAAIRVRYVLEVVAPSAHAELFAPLGRVSVPPPGIHGVELALFGRSASLTDAATALDAMIVRVTALRADAPPVSAEAAARAAVAALRLPIDRYAEIETPLAGPDLVALGELVSALVAQLGASGLRDAALDTALANLSAALPATIDDLPGFIAASEATITAVLARAELQGISLPPEHSSLEIPRTFGRNFADVTNPNIVGLGRLLFFDPVLSSPRNDRACSSCHRADAGYGDGLQHGLGLSGGDLRNTPPVLLAPLQYGSGWDLAAVDVAAHAATAMTDLEQMAGSAPVSSLGGIPEYVTRFDAGFVDGLTAPNVSAALAAFLAAAPPLSTPVDRFFRGESTALTSAQLAGLSVFLGPGRCASCHRPPLFSGTAPPAFEASEVRVIGVPLDSTGTTLDPDLGRGALPGGSATDAHAFRVPILRNLGESAPYMHNGAYGTLTEVVAFYDAGAGPGLGLTVPNADPRLIPLQLTPGEIVQLVAFLGALDDTSTPRPQAPATVPSGLPVGGRGF